jgi:hypothetical protein
MDGQLLHFSVEVQAGLIRAGDGRRYPFYSSEWRTAEPPQAGDLVDFEIADGRATEVYRTGRVATPAPSGAWLGARPGLVWGGLVLLACVLPLLNIPLFSISLITLPGWLNSMTRFATGLAGNRGGEAAAMQSALTCFYLLYIVPAAAFWLVVREFQGMASSILRIAVGICGIVTPFAVWILSALVAAANMPAATRRPNPLTAPLAAAGDGSASVWQFFSLMGIGWYLLIAASICLIAAGLGWNPFRRQPVD